MKNLIKILGAKLLYKEELRHILGGLDYSSCKAWCNAEHTTSVECPSGTVNCTAVDDVGVTCDNVEKKC
jgi:hypothetical protein